MPRNGLSNCRGHYTTAVAGLQGESLGKSKIAAEKPQEVAKEEGKTGGRTAAEATETLAALPIHVATVFDGGQNFQIFFVVRFHGNSLANMLQGGDLVAQGIVGDGAEVVPKGIALLNLLQ